MSSRDKLKDALNNLFSAYAEVLMEEKRPFDVLAETPVFKVSLTLKEPQFAEQTLDFLLGLVKKDSQKKKKLPTRKYT